MNDTQKLAQVDSMYAQARGAFEGIPEISATDVRKRCEAGEALVLVDVRTPEERDVSMIEGAITAQQFEADAAKHEGATVVCYCTIGGRSGQYTQQLLQRGVNAFNMPGAVLSWSHAGGAFVDSNGPTKRVSTHGPQLDLLAEGYKAVW